MSFSIGHEISITCQENMDITALDGSCIRVSISLKITREHINKVRQCAKVLHARDELVLVGDQARMPCRAENRNTPSVIAGGSCIL